MVKKSTIIFKFNKLVGRKRIRQNEQLLVKGLNEEFSPSESTVNNILSFARACRFEKSESLGSIEMVIN